MRLLFVAGWMRSGTTLLTELLGSATGTLAVGELSTMWTALERNDDCSCGEPVRSCPLWGLVAERVLAEIGIGSGGAYSYLDVDAVVREALRIKRLPVLWHLHRKPQRDVPADIAFVVDVMRLVLTVVGEVTNGATVVDSSKRPAAMLVFAMVPGLSLTPVHLVRDPRAVAFSESRSRHREGIRPTPGPPGRRALLSAVHWNVNSVLCHVLGSRFPAYQLLRYERLATYPRATLSELTRRIALPPVRFVDEVTVELRPSHVISGNPSRLAGRQRTIRVDERWRRQLRPSERFAVAALTAPVRLWLAIVSRRWRLPSDRGWPTQPAHRSAR